jgi:predicted HTH transcriptional regulator
MLFAKPLKEIAEQDIQNLVDDQIEESAHLDYKREVTFSPSGKKELAKDISAFANSGGGVILYGIEEKKDEHGIPVPVSPIHGIESSIDRERLLDTYRHNDQE